jgi:two-component system NtrC family sensor kinase
MGKKLYLMTVIAAITFLSSFAEKPITVFYEKNGMMTYDELTRNVLINSQNEKVATTTFHRAYSKKDWSVYAEQAMVLASINYRAGQKESAIDYFKKAISGFVNSGSAEGQAMANCGIALIFQYNNQLDSAVQYFNHSIKLNHSANNFTGELKVRFLLSKAYESTEDHASTLLNFKEAISILPNIPDPNMKAYLYNSYSEELIHSKNEDEALTYLQKALALSDKNKVQKAVIYRNIGIVNFNKGDYVSATGNFEKSLASDFRLPALRLLRDTYLKLYASGKVGGDEKKENLYSTNYKLLKDSVEDVLNSRMLSPDSFTLELKEKLFVTKLLTRTKSMSSEMNRNSIEFNQRLTEAELDRLKAEEALERFHEERMNEEAANREREDLVKELEKEKAIQELALTNTELAREKQQRWILILFSGVVLVTTILLFLYNRYRLKRKSHSALDSAFVELKTAHRKLKETQDQLIRSEKMASLGQMTAGIAHEIQNPLNFVLNFAEGSKELLKELQETTDENDRKEITDSLNLNLTKISEHGKRADAIVKNMLQHSRVNKSERVPTDLNKLAEEYFQLAFHGLRAKDSSFQCTLEKELDPNFPMLELIQQDISRVLLNLFNNAFYAVNVKAQKNNPGYTPTVKLSTMVYGNFAFLTIHDNGDGIPKEIKEKIFEPFFTTKPAGQGTGLGLSLSFEIIKNHGARMEMESEIGAGTTFKLIFKIGG